MFNINQCLNGKADYFRTDFDGVAHYDAVGRAKRVRAKQLAHQSEPKRREVERADDACAVSGFTPVAARRYR